ncbi:MAG: hypothetical protein AAGG45_01670 [Pseudomonadota bacterium]
MTAEAPQFPPRTPEELAAQKRRNVWLALMLVAFLILAFVITITRIRDGIYWSMPDHSSDVVSMPDPNFVPLEQRAGGPTLTETETAGPEASALASESAERSDE